jgi:16S rRNA (uracil1498-N3)-methyltransferase
MDNLKQLFFDGSLTTGDPIKLEKPLAKRLSKVLRLSVGTHIALFNGKDGLFKVKITSADCKKAKVIEQLKPLVEINNVTLFAAIVKKDAMDRIFRQATELSINIIHPCLSDYCMVNKLNTDRISTLLIEASEQCERLDIPKLEPLTPLKDAIKNFAGTIFWCDEVEGGKWGNHTSKNGDGILIGPEGGFSPKEREWLQQQSNIQPVGLGVNILRADTASAVAIGLFFEAFQ